MTFVYVVTDLQRDEFALCGSAATAAIRFTQLLEDYELPSPTAESLVSDIRGGITFESEGYIKVERKEVIL